MATRLVSDVSGIKREHPANDLAPSKCWWKMEQAPSIMVLALTKMEEYIWLGMYK